jgi:hypothetical protein
VGASARKQETTIALKDLGALIPATVAIGAALVYGVLIVSYSEFYAELGIRPGDVGLELGPGLGGIVGVAVLLLVAMALLCVYLYAVSRWLARGQRTRFVVSFIVGVLLAVVVIAWLLNGAARDAAARARAGTPVGPLTLLGLEVVALRADRAELHPADPKAADAAAYLALRDEERLMYLGRFGTSLVLYDPEQQSSWQVPASMFTVRTLNCDRNVEGRDPACASVD